MTEVEIDSLGGGLIVLANEPDFSRERLSDFIRSHPEIRILKVSASDVLEEPHLSGRWFDVHLFDGRQSCVHLTTVLSEATGFVVALKNT